jgi:hypothetical protein
LTNHPSGLQCHCTRFSGLVAELDEGDSYEYVKALTDVYRLNMFDVLMQYRAIFFDAPQVGSSSTRPRYLALPQRGCVSRGGSSPVCIPGARPL